MSTAALVTTRGQRDDSSTDHERDTAVQAGCEVLHELPHGVVVRGTDAQYAHVAELGFRVKVFPDTDYLDVGKYHLHITQQLPILEPDYEIPSGSAATWPHHLVQLDSPPIPMWVSEIKSLGVTVVDLVSRYALFVMGSPTAVENLSTLSYVTWIGALKPGYRIGPSLFGQHGPIRHVVIKVYPKTARTEAINLVQQLGGTVVSQRLDRPYWTIVADLDADAVPPVARLPNVRSLSYLSPIIEPIDERSCQIVAGHVGVPGYNAWLTDIELDGTGVTIAFADSGISPHLDLATSIGAGFRYKAAVKFTQPNTTDPKIDGLGHGTYVAGIAVGNGLGTAETDPPGFLLGQGIAPATDFVSLKLLNDKNLGWEDQNNIETWVAQALLLGASIMNNSWNDPDLTYNDVARKADDAVRSSSLTMVCGAGNSAINPVTVPGLAKNVITVGATDSGRGGGVVDTMWPNSRRGPAPDGRLVPTVVAPGMIIVSTRGKCGAEFVDSAGGQHALHALDANKPIIQPGSVVCDLTTVVGVASGTSWAVPHVSGACALLTESWVTRTGLAPSPALLKAWLINGADDIGQAACPAAAHKPGTPGCVHAPSFTSGWGRISLQNMLKAGGGPRLFVDQTVTFVDPGDVFSMRVAPVNTAMPMRVTLVWTDPPAAVEEAPALHHDLDLEVQSDAGVLFMGNAGFDAGFTSPAGAGAQADDINNVECVYIQNPAGPYTIRVRAPSKFDVNFPSQNFALVIENAQVQAAAPVSIAMLIDRSGSMTASGYASGATAAAALFIDLLHAGDEVAVVSFGANSQTEYALTAVADAAARVAAQNAVNAIAFGGCTFMGQGIEQSKLLLGAAVNPMRAIVLLSDGYDNKGCQPFDLTRPSAAQATAAAPAIPVHACALGPASDQDLLQSLAAQSAGQYYFAPTEADLGELYAYIAAELSGEAVIVNESFGTSTHAVDAYVDRQATAVKFVVSWADTALQWVPTAPAPAEIRVQIVDPKGHRMHPGSSYAHTVSSPGRLTLGLESPLPGRWRIVVQTAGRTHTRCTVAAFVRSPVRLDVTLDNVRVAAGSSVEMSISDEILESLGKTVRLSTQVVGPTASLSRTIAQHKNALRAIRAPASVVRDGVPTAVARLLAFNRVRRSPGRRDVFRRESRHVLFRTAPGAGGRVATIGGLDTPGSYNVTVAAEGTTPQAGGGRGSTQVSRIRRKVLKSILVVEDV